MRPEVIKLRFNAPKGACFTCTSLARWRCGHEGEGGGEFVEKFAATLLRGGGEADEDLPSAGPALGSIPARNFARDHGGADRALGSVVGGLHVVVQAAKMMLSDVPHAAQKVAITGFGHGTREQFVPGGFQGRATLGEGGGRQLIALAAEFEDRPPQLLPGIEIR